MKMISDNDSKKSSIEMITFLILGIIFFPTFIASLLFLLKIEIQPSTFPLGILTLIVLYFIVFFKAKDKKTFFLSIFVAFGLAAGTILISCFLIDTSYDGWMCHVPAVINLSNGWNPVYEHVSHAQNINLGDYRVWIEQYPNFTLIYGATLYRLTGNMFAGTSITTLLAICTYLICFDIFSKNKKMPMTIVYISAIVIALNQVLISQLFSYYNDGALGNALISLLVILYGVAKGYTPIRHNFVLLFFLSVYSCILINSKFSFALMTAIILLVFFGYYLIIGTFKKQFKSVVLFTVVISVVVVVVAANSYWFSMAKHQNLGYSIVGEGSVDIITSNTPEILRDTGKYESFFKSLTIDKFHYYDTLTYKFKPPYYISMDDIQEVASTPDVKLSGFGPLFQLILWVSIVMIASWFMMLMIKLFASKKQKIEKLNEPKLELNLRQKWFDKLYLLELLTIGVLIAIIIILPDIWWARYIPFFYVLPCLAIIIFKDNWEPRYFNNMLANFILIVYLLSATISLGFRIYYANDASNQIKKDLEHFKQISKESEYPLSIVNYNSKINHYKMPVIRQLFKDNDIDFVEFDENSTEILIFDEENVLGIALAEQIIKPEFEVTDRLIEATDVFAYFDTIKANMDSLITILSVKDDASTYAFKLEDLPFALVKLADLSVQQSYIGIIRNDGSVYELVSDEAFNFVFNNKINVGSAGFNAGNYSNIIHSNVNYSKDMRGLNICIFDKETLMLIDSVNIDVYLDEYLQIKR